MNTKGLRYFRIENILKEKFSPSTLVIQDESYLHKGHSGNTGGDETHFSIQLVSKHFKGLTLLESHRMVNDALGEEFKVGLHALSLKTRAE